MPLTDQEVDRIADAVVAKQKAFSLDSKEHYDSHQRIDRLLNMYDAAQNIAWKTFISLLVVGGILVAAVAAGVGKLFSK